MHPNATRSLLQQEKAVLVMRLGSGCSIGLTPKHKHINLMLYSEKNIDIYNQIFYVNNSILCI